MQLQLEHRRHQRIEISRPVELLEPQGTEDEARSIAGSTLNISNEGIAARFDENLDVGSLRPVLMHLEADAPPVSKEARIVWSMPSPKGSSIDAGLELVESSEPSSSHRTEVEEELEDETASNLLAPGCLVRFSGEAEGELTGRILSCQAGRTAGSIRLEVQLEPEEAPSSRAASRKVFFEAKTNTAHPSEEAWDDKLQTEEDEYRAGWVVWLQRCVNFYIIPALTVLWDLTKRASAAAVDLLRKSPPAAARSGRLWDKARPRLRAFGSATRVASIKAGHKIVSTAGKVMGSQRNRRRPSQTNFRG